LLNFNSNELKQNQKKKKKTTTIEEGDDIVAITFFVAKPQKKAEVAISLQQSH
jgi:hypothetical protein